MVEALTDGLPDELAEIRPRKPPTHRPGPAASRFLEQR